MTSLDEIRRKLPDVGGDGRLTLQAAEIDVPEVSHFFAKGMRVDILTLSHASASKMSDPITITGKADVVGFQDLTVTLTFRIEDDALSITMDGSFPEDKNKLQLPLVNWIGLEDLELSLRQESEYNLLSFAFRGNISVPDSKKKIPVSLAPTGDGGWQLDIAGDDGYPIPKVASLKQLLQNNALTSFIPDIPLPDLHAIELRHISTLFNVARATIMYFTIEVGVSDELAIAEKVKIERGSMRLIFTMKNPQDKDLREFIGIAKGTIKIDNTPVPVFIQIDVGSDTRTAIVGIDPDSDGVTLGLSSLFTYAGGEGFHESLPVGLRKIPDLRISELEIAVSLKNPLGLQRLSFAAQTKTAWPVIENFLTVQNLSFALDLLDLADAKNRKVGGFLHSTFSFSDTVWLYFYVDKDPEGDWTLSGGLPPDTQLNLTDLVKKLLKDFVVLPRDAPTIVLDKADVTVVPGKRVEFQAGSPSKWTLVEGLDIEGFKLHFNYDTEAVSKFSGSLEARILFEKANVGVNLSAALGKEDNGWQFEGSTGAGQKIPIGTLIADIGKLFGDVELPSAITDLTIENLHISFNTKTKNFKFTCDGKFEVHDQEVDISVTIDVKNKNGSYEKIFGGTITIGSLQFKLTFLQNQKSTIFVAAYSRKDDKTQRVDNKQNIKELVSHASPALAKPIPDTLTIELKDVIFAYSKVDTDSKFLFGLDIGAGVNLSNLPLVGQVLPPDETLSVDDLRLLVASKGLTKSEVTSFNNLLPKEVTRLAVADETSTESEGNGADNSDAQFAIRQGVSASAKLKFGGSTRALALPVAGASSDGRVSQTDDSQIATTDTSTSTSDTAKWFTVQKSFGPVYFEKIGVQYKDAELWFLLTGSLSVGGLTLELDGLAVGSPLQEFHPKFDLRGVGIDYKNGPLEIGGAFLRTRVGEGPEARDEYTGQAIIKTQTLTLSALGSYTRLEGHPSLLIYAVLDYPIGGPAFCFVTGLAAGFGYNRSLKIPSLDQLPQFPLIAQAIKPPDPRPSLENQCKALQQYIPPTIGQSFFAVGIKFTSFKMIESFALLTVSFGSRFEVDLLGMSTLTAPTPEEGKPVFTPVAQVTMAIRARFAPDEGFLGIAGQLTSDSYILSRDCHLTGGFAFYSWFAGEHAGDFVQTLGGYHPKYDVPKHYPKVPRVGINWRVNDNLSIKAEAYYALTASALMAGGHLQATWESGNLKAWFNAAADFLISWQPYYYRADVSVSVRVSYTFQFLGTQHLDVDVGADLHIWGPEFSGNAHITLSIISFDVDFGSPAPSKPEAIKWDAFKKAFFPPDKDICSINVKDGMVGVATVEEKPYWIVNPKEFTLVTNSVIPAKKAYKGNDKIADEIVEGASTSFGIGSMDIGSDNLSTSHTITITRNGAPVDTDFMFTAVLKDVPTGMWGTSLTPSLNGQRFIKKTIAGFEIKPKQPTSSQTASIKRSNLQYSQHPVHSAYIWQSIPPFVASAQADKDRRATIRNRIASSDTATARNKILQAMGVTDVIDIDSTLADDFLAAPQVGTIAGQ